MPRRLTLFSSSFNQSKKSGRRRPNLRGYILPSAQVIHDHLRRDEPRRIASTDEEDALWHKAITSD